MYTLFLFNDMLEKFVVYTYILAESKYYAGNWTARLTDINELKTLYGVLYIADMMRRNHPKSRNRFRLNGLECELQKIRLDDKRKSRSYLKMSPSLSVQHVVGI